MKITTGVDIVDLRHMQKTLADTAQLQRVLHPGDITRNDAEHIAGRIALKEATIKALGLAPGSWLDIHVHTHTSGKPVITIDDTDKSLVSLDGSISHHADMVVAFVVALFDDKHE